MSDQEVDSDESKLKQDVPAQVFDEFLQSLAKAEVPNEMISRLRKTLKDDKSFGERALRGAVLGEEEEL